MPDTTLATAAIVHALARSRRGVAVTGLLAVALAACGGAAPHRAVTIVDNQSPTEPRLDVGALALRMPRSQVESISADAGWRVEGEPGDDAAWALVPPASDAAERYELTCEAGHIVQLAVNFRVDDERRIDRRHQAAVSRIQPDGSWAMTDAHRRTLVVVAPHGRRVVAIHLATLRDQTGAQAALTRYLGE